MPAPAPLADLPLYGALLRSYPAGVVVLCDEGLRILVVDGRALRAAGMEPSGLVGQPVGALCPPEVTARLEPQLREAFAGRETVQEVTWRGRRWRVRALPVTEGDAPVRAVLAHARDVTRARDTERALAASEARVRRLIDELPTPVFLMDLDRLGVEFANRAFEQAFGWAPRDVVALGGEVVPQLVHPEDQALAAERFQAVIAAPDGAVVEARLRLRHAAGRWRMARARCVVFARHADGRPRAMLATLTDETDAEQAFEALRHSEERYRIATAVTNDVVYDARLAEERILWNEAMGEVFGHDIGPARTTDGGWWWERVHPEDQPRVAASLDAAYAGGAPDWRAEYRFRKRDGQYAVVVDRARIVRDADGRATRLIGSMRDETARRALDSHLRQVAKLDALGTLAGGIAHDFNNILAGILGFAELATDDLRRGETAEAVGAIDEVVAAARRARDLVRQILAFSRKDDARRERLDLVALVEETRRLLRATLPATVEFDVVREGEAALEVVGDPTLLQQSLLNLATNAEHAMRGCDDRRLTVVLGRASLPAADAVRLGMAPGPHVRVVVRDTGRGMPPEVVERAFEPFFTTKAVGEGTGLGLAMVHGAVTSAGGAVELLSEPGRGTEVVLRLPLAPPAPALDAGSGGGAPPAHARTVLVVDDEPSVRRVLERQLRRLGHLPVCVPSAEAALARLADGSAPVIDVVLTDLTMPGLSGDRLAERVRKAHPGLPVMLMTGYGGSVTAAQTRAAGVVAVLEKPIDLATLTTALAALEGRPDRT